MTPLSTDRFNASASCKELPKGYDRCTVRRIAPDGTARTNEDAIAILQRRYPGRDVKLIGNTATRFVGAVAKEGE